MDNLDNLANLLYILTPPGCDTRIARERDGEAVGGWGYYIVEVGKVGKVGNYAIKGQAAGTEGREIRNPGRNLAAAVIRHAIEDLRRGRPCSTGNGEPCGTGGYVGCHVCADDARRFLTSDVCRDLLIALDLDPGTVLSRLGLNGEE